MLPVIAQRMGLATRRNASLWKDRALIELNRAVLWSYEKSGVYIVDHHTAAAQFITHVDRELSAGRVVSADWAWVNPPLSASTTATYHRTFEPPDFSLRPNFYPLATQLSNGFVGASGSAEVEPSATDGGCPWSGDSSGGAPVAAIGSAGNQ
jgi:nitric oxide synthase oxygenase domain/subunit